MGVWDDGENENCKYVCRKSCPARETVCFFMDFFYFQRDWNNILKRTRHFARIRNDNIVLRLTEVARG